MDSRTLSQPSTVDLLFVHKGGSSRDIIKALLDLDSRPFVKGLDDITPDLMDKFGPALVSYFQVYDDRKEKGRTMGSRPAARVLANPCF